MTELSSHSVTSAPPDASESPGPASRAPLAGIVASVLMVVGLGGWTAYRVSEATTEKQELAERRAADAQRAAGEAKAAPLVSVVVPKPSHWTPTVEIDGTLAAARAAELGFETPGRLAHVAVRMGDVVKAGTLLATLDTGEISAQRKAAQAQIRAAEAALALAADQERRTASMVQSGSLAEATGVQTAQQKALASAQLDAARAQLALTDVALANHRLVAPFAGTVTRAPDGIGRVVAPGAPLFELVDLTRLKLEGTLGEHDAALVRAGTKLKIESETGPVEGNVTVVLGSVDAATRRVRMEAEFDNADGKLRAGSFVRAVARGAEGIDVLELPHDVLRPGGQDELFVVAGEVLKSRRVVYAVSPQGTLLVRRGLSAGERVVRSPKADATDGARVRVSDAAPAPRSSQ